MKITIHGYTGPLQEGHNLTLTCEVDSNLLLIWIFTANGKMPKLISRSRTFFKYGTELSDAGEYTCILCPTCATTSSVLPKYDHEYYAHSDLSASVQVEVLQSVSDNSNSVEASTYNIITGSGTTNTPATDNRSTVEVFTHDVIIGGSATGVVIIVIIVALVIALVQSCRKQTRFNDCKYKLILLIFSSQTCNCVSSSLWFKHS